MADIVARISKVARGSWLLFAALIAANASNYLFHVVSSRLLSHDDYAGLSAVLAVLVVMSVPLSSLQAVVARRTAEAGGSGATSWRMHAKPAFILGGISGALLLMAAPLVAVGLHVDLATAALTALYAVPAVAVSALRGSLQGSSLFGRLAAVSLLPVGVRLLSGIALLHWGAGLTGAIAASVIAEVAGLGLALSLMARGSASPHGLLASTKRMLNDVSVAAVTLAATWLLVEVDLVLARRLLPASGTYAAAGLLARSVLFVPAAVGFIALPLFTRDSGSDGDTRRWFHAALALVVALAAAAVGVLSLAGDVVVGIAFGRGYAHAADMLPPISVAMLFMSIVQLVAVYHVANGRRFFAPLMALAGLEVALMLMFNDDASQFIAILVATSALAALVSLRSVLRGSRRPILSLPGDVEIFSSSPVAAPALSVVVPCHNEGSGLVRSIGSIVTALDRLERDFEIIVVSDGSTDGCESGLADFGRVTVLRYPQQQGKGAALRIGLRHSRARYVAFIDADGELDAGEFVGFLALMDLYDPDIVLGSKRHPLSDIRYPPLRRMMSITYQALIRALFGINVRDTQTGMKLMRRDVLDAVLPRMREKRFAFDLELLVLARQLGYTRFFEAPIKLNYGFRSTVAPRAVLRILADTAAIFWRRYVLRAYEAPTSSRVQVPVRLLAARKAA